MLTGNAGNNVINGWAGADTMRGLGGNDTYIVDNVGDIVDESCAGSGGNDTVQASVTVNLYDATHFRGDIENVAPDRAANVNAVGNCLANTLTGNAGNNVINGGCGNDTITGGAGNDVFLFNTALNAATNVDTITDFSVPDDSSSSTTPSSAHSAPGTFAASAFHIGAAAATAAQHIIYNSANGWLSYDADGAGGAAQTHFATVSAGLAMTNADFFVV